LSEHGDVSETQKIKVFPPKLLTNCVSAYHRSFEGMLKMQIVLVHRLTWF